MRRGSAVAFVIATAFAALLTQASFAANTIVIGGKIFTESYVLGEIAAQTIETSSHVPVTRKLGMEAPAFYSRR